MATLQQQITAKFLSKLTDSAKMDAPAIEQLGVLLLTKS